MTRTTFRIASLAAIALLALAAPAFAQTAPTQQVYGGDQGEVLGNFQGGGGEGIIPPPQNAPEVADEQGGGAPDVAPTTRTERGAAPSTAGDLPFTGFEALLVALAGAALLGGGFAMRRVAREPAA